MKTHLLHKIPGLALEARDGRTFATMAGPFQMPITCEFWEVENAGAGNDRFRFKLGAAIKNMGVGPYSHPTAFGCEIAIQRFFLDAGCIDVPADNSHLDDFDKAIASRIAAAFAAHDGIRNGDYVRFPDKAALHRVCNVMEHCAQTTRGGSYSISESGRASYSGSLDSAILNERFKLTSETEKGRFWFFSHNQAGAGRGVDVWLPCRVFDIVDFSMSEDEAKAHPLAVKSAEFWGETHRDTIQLIEALMKGKTR